MRARFEKRHIKKTVFRTASIERLEDAKCLVKGGRFQGAIYLCGYVLECYLKFCVCVARGTAGMEEGEAKELGHDLHKLLDKAGMVSRLYGNGERRVTFLNINSRWSTEIRYLGRVSSRRESEKFPEDSEWLLGWLRTESES